MSILIVIVLVAEVAARSFWALRFGVPFFHPERILSAFYPEIKKVIKECSHSKETYNVLLLGGSIMSSEYGAVDKALAEHLAMRGIKEFRIFNLSLGGQTSRDALLKYSALNDAHFDLVVFSPSVNEIRVNNIPPEHFRQDYGHFGRYRIVNAMVRYHGTAVFALPFSLHYALVSLYCRLSKNRSIPLGRPREAWVQYGSTVQNESAFRSNVAALVELASRRKERLVLQTVALHKPDDYSHELFLQKKLDYRLHFHPFGIWGELGNVLAAMDVLNNIVRKLAKTHEGLFLSDQDVLLSRTKQNFNDPCHLTIRGSCRYARNIMKVVSQFVDKSEPDHTH